VFLVSLFEEIGLTGGLLAALILIGSMFMGERRKRRAAEVRAETARKGARASDVAKDTIVDSAIRRDEEVDKAEAEADVKRQEVDEKADALDSAAVKSNSALADAWNSIMSRKK